MSIAPRVTSRSTLRARVRRAGVGLAVAVLAATTFGTAAGAADDPLTGTVTKLLYAVDTPLCSVPANPTLMRCFALKRENVRRGTRGAYAYRPTVAAGPSGGLRPSTLAKAYDINPKVNRSSTTVAVVLWYDAPHVLADLNTFDRKYGLKQETATSFRKVNQRGRTSSLPQADAGSSGEITLDTQAVRAVCNTCRILLVEADRPTADSLAAAVNTAVRLGASVVSNSYGTADARMPTSVVNAYNHPGVAITVSTGDDGWFGWDYDNEQANTGDGAVSFPSSLPFVVSVGGTTLRLTSTGARSSETVWNNNGSHDATGNTRGRGMGASGGGCSLIYPASPWQQHFPNYAAANCHGKRLAADVSLDADPQTGLDVYDSYGSGGWVTVGGTSLSAPLAAGMYALAGGAAGAHYPASAVYGNSAVTPGRRYDVTVGGNGFCAADTTAACATATRQRSGLLGPDNPNGLGIGLVDCSFPRNGADATDPVRSRECNAAPGFDGASGVGAPRSPALFARSEPTASITVPSTLRHKVAATFRAGVTEPIAGTHATSFQWTWGDSTSTHTTSATPRHTYARAGRYVVTLVVIDSRYQVGYRQTTVTVR